MVFVNAIIVLLKRTAAQILLWKPNEYCFFLMAIDDADLNVTHRKRRVHEQDLLENDFDDMVSAYMHNVSWRLV